MTSVKQKVAAIRKKCAEIDAGARKLQSAINQQQRVNAAAAHQIELGTKKLQEGIKQKGREVYAAVKKLEGAIQAQQRANVSYIRNFYSGEGKE